MWCVGHSGKGVTLGVVNFRRVVLWHGFLRCSWLPYELPFLERATIGVAIFRLRVDKFERVVILVADSFIRVVTSQMNTFKGVFTLRGEYILIGYYSRNVGTF